MKNISFKHKVYNHMWSLPFFNIPGLSMYCYLFNQESIIEDLVVFIIIHHHLPLDFLVYLHQKILCNYVFNDNPSFTVLEFNFKFPGSQLLLSLQLWGFFLPHWWLFVWLWNIRVYDQTHMRALTPCSNKGPHMFTLYFILYLSHDLWFLNRSHEIIMIWIWYFCHPNPMSSPLVLFMMWYQY